MNQTGRVFPVYLDEIPVLVRMEDGRPVEVDKDNPLFSALGENIVPTINIVPALLIRGKENYIFWGNGIQVKDIESEYKRLQLGITEYEQEKRHKGIEKKEYTIPKLPKLNIKKQNEEVKESVVIEESIDKE